MAESRAAAGQTTGAPKRDAKSAVSRPSRTNGGPPDVQVPLEHELDRLSLEQAVRDFEIANARVVDLTQRLISANERIVELQRACDVATTSLVEVQSHLASLTDSQAFRVADKLWAIRDLIRR